MRLQKDRRLERRPKPVGQMPRRVAMLAGLIFGITIANAAPLLDIVRGMPEGGWKKVNLNGVSSVWPPSKDWPGPVYYPYSIIHAWSGFAWDNKRGDLIIYGGGHANTAGNDVYKWRGSTQLWERASLPSKVTNVDFTFGSYWGAADGPDNAPPAAHTYQNNAYLEIADRFFTFGGAAYNTGSSYLKQRPDGTYGVTGPYTWDPSKADGSKVGGTDGSGVDPSVLGGRMWQNRDGWVNALGARKPFFMGSATTVYAKENGKDVLYISASESNSQRHLYRYTINDFAAPTSDVWEYIGLNGYTQFYDQGAAGYDPVRKIYVRTGPTATPFGYWNVGGAFPTVDVVIRPTDISGTYDFQFSNSCGMQFDPKRSRFFIWCGGGQVFSLNAPSGPISATGWEIRPELMTSAIVPGPRDTNGGVLGKWKYASDLDAYVALKNPTEGEVWVYKPIAWVDPGTPPPPVPMEVIVDNASAGVQDATGGRTFTGTWCLSSGAAPYGNDSIYSCGTGSNTYRWTPNVAAAGSYDVYVRWTTHPNRSIAVPVTVNSSTGTVIKTYNEQMGGGNWTLHGRYNFAAGKVGYIEVNSNNGQANADAIRLTPAVGPPPPPPPVSEIVIDSAPAGVQDVAGGQTFTGLWCLSSGFGPYGSGSIYSCGDGVDAYRWTPTITTAGNYDVYVWWTTHPNRSTNVPVSVTHTAGTTTKNYNEQVGGGQWVLHGRYNFATGRSGYVTTNDINGQAAADAVRFVPIR